MKKLLAILLAGMLVFSLAACGGTNGDVDVDDVDDSSIIDEYKIKNIPALFFIKNGEVLNKHIGTINRPMLVDELNKY